MSEQDNGTPTKGKADTTGAAPVPCLSLLGVPVVSSDLRAAIRGLEDRTRKLTVLCGEMLATLRVNTLRGSLRTDDDAQWGEILDGWSQRHKDA